MPIYSHAAMKVIVTRTSRLAEVSGCLVNTLECQTSVQGSNFLIRQGEGSLGGRGAGYLLLI